MGWPQLDYVEGPVPVLCLLGLKMSIRELRVPSLTHNEPKRRTNSNSISRTDAFLDLVHVTSPETLSFAVDLRSKLAAVAFFRALAQAVPGLKCLTISVVYSATVVPDLVSTHTERFIHSFQSYAYYQFQNDSLHELQNVPLMFLSIRIQGRSFDRRELPDERWKYTLEPFAILLPSIKYIEFVNKGIYWTAEEQGNARHLRRISRDEGEQAKKQWSK
jgi:hypothetical protein